MIDYQDPLKQIQQHDLVDDERNQIEDLDVFLVRIFNRVELDFLIVVLVERTPFHFDRSRYVLVRYERIVRSNHTDLFDIFSCDNITWIALSSA
jgi:hypothetical protein